MDGSRIFKQLLSKMLGFRDRLIWKNKGFKMFKVLLKFLVSDSKKFRQRLTLK